MYYFNYVGELKSWHFHDTLYFLPHILPLFNIVCFGRSPVLPWPCGLRTAGWSEVLHTTIFMQGEKNAVIVPQLMVKQTLSSIQKKGFQGKN